jgi:iron complex outermembrane receptor protein
VGTASIFDYRHGTPTSVVDLGAGYSWDRFEIDAQARWQSHFTDYYPSGFGATPFQINDYITMNARIGYRVTQNATVALTGEQLAQSHIFEAAGTPVERRVFVTLSTAL